jgi:hypothetical protein
MWAILPTLAYPQTPIRLQGMIYDSTSKRQIPFAHIIINQGVTGGNADLDGRFNIEVKQKIERVTFAHLGYESVVYEPKTSEDFQALQGFLRIALKAKENNLGEVVLTGENPAHKIIKRTLKNRDLHNPKKLPFYSYNTYSKLLMDWEGSQNLELPPPTDTAGYKMTKFLQKNYFFLAETVTTYKYLAPTYQYEKVIANKISGFKNPAFMALSTQGQVLNFYEDNVTMLNRKYLNPISPKSWENYDFAIEDTLLVEPDTLYWLSFEPLPNRNFDGLKGKMAIHTQGYAIQYMEIQPALTGEELSVSFRLEQQYEWIDKKRWFAKDIRTELIFKRMKQKGAPLVSQWNTHFADFDFQNKPPLSDFRDVSLDFDANANAPNDELWAKHRADSLNVREENTYQTLDSIGRKFGFDKILRITEALTFGRVPLRIKHKKVYFQAFDIDITNLLKFNRYEGTRMGLGLITSDAFSKRWVFGSYFAYGTRDKAFKHGFSALYRPFKGTDASLMVLYKNDVLEPARARFMEENVGLVLTPNRNIFASRMDKIRHWEARAQIRPLQNLRLGAVFTSQQISPAYNYTFQIPQTNGDTLAYQNNFQVSELSFHLQYFWGAQYVRMGTVRSLAGVTLPALYVSYARGLRTFDSPFQYEKWQARFWYDYTFRKLGTTQIDIWGGYLRGNVPYSLLWNGQGLGNQVPVIVPNYFQTMGLYEFLVDRYAYVFLRHNFRRLLYKASFEHFQPEVVLHHNMGWGILRKPAQHIGEIETTDFRQGFLESGLMINNLYKYNYTANIKMGIGAGVFIRYGAYRDFDKFSNNVFYKLSSTFSF